MARVLAAVLALLSAASLCRAVFVIEKGGLKVVLPQEAKEKYPGGFDVALANFGSPRYGGTLRARLIYVDPTYGRTETCGGGSCAYGCSDFSTASPPLDLRKEGGENYIMMVDRGPTSNPCKFAEKVWNVQSAGARGAIVVNFEDRMTTMEAPDEDDEANVKFLTNITIPATFVTKSTGDALKALMKGGQPVYVVMDWQDILPKKQQVSWEFWTNSNDQCGPVCDVQKEFIKEFVPVAKEFDAHNWTVFTPHYIVWICPTPYRSSSECNSQCIHKGRYCSPDPDGNLTQGYSGSDVVQENLRQLCVFQMAKDAGRAYLWWDYVTKFGEQCDMESKKYGQECAEHVFGQINQDNWSSVDKLRQCIGGQQDDSDHPIMEAQLAAQKGNSSTGEGEVFILPTIRVNGVQYRGKMATAEVLRAICAGFTAGNMPQACSKAMDDACMQGGKGYQDCAARTDGKTQCVNTFTGYNCTCGHGFISHVDRTGQETCLDINECLSISQLDPKCTCERCACNNTRGGYECITDIPNECSKDHGGCWHADFKIKGQSRSFSACKDNLPAYKDALAHGLPVDGIPLHTCTCPPCFTAVEKGGKITCTPKCDLQYCDLDVGVCHAEPGSGGVGPGVIVLIIVAVVVVLSGVGYVAYQYRLRSIMQQEVRAIMAQYMPLEDSDPDGALAGLGNRLKRLAGGGGGSSGNGAANGGV
ncbi:vacuolar-sorting receptor 3-like [Chlorella sorokiniana]|uniref:Vacuolar-sorting receptor 3-like n=1 Tax=Chlorella sorokiniana TaxID=3076 RepID=A0A2P6TNI7_CHLSO|nr:vacuolar-sorting receptor 3-like [Chlorella sorokiniana]|eukprot:PRW50883.1 vacuolar-sorting receptor 3-like [Chlorella sorokiniana]